jgi:hypothetical protein
MASEYRKTYLARKDGTPQIDISAIKGEPGTGYESGAKGPFRCDNCEYYKNGSCGQKNMVANSKQPLTKDGRRKVDANGCCEYVDRIGAKK